MIEIEKKKKKREKQKVKKMSVDNGLWNTYKIWKFQTVLIVIYDICWKWLYYYNYLLNTSHLKRDNVYVFDLLFIFYSYHKKYL